jgi:hypothetical protein
LPFLVVGGYPRFQYQGCGISTVDAMAGGYDNDDVYLNYVIEPHEPGPATDSQDWPSFFCRSLNLAQAGPTPAQAGFPDANL